MTAYHQTMQRTQMQPAAGRAAEMIKNERIPVDVFALYTDSETWSGWVHPHTALADYRRTMGIQSRSIVSAFTTSFNTIADPKDPLMLDTVGLDASLPTIISNFAKGGF